MTQHGGFPAVSAEDIVACVQGVACSEQAAPTAFDQAVKGIAGENEVPYAPTPTSQACSGKTTYLAITFDYVGANSLRPTIDEIKQALCDHGSVAAGIFASLAFQSYTSGVFQETPPSSPPWMNHWVTIIGWDDSKQAWRVKNSWGTAWGENGFAWVDYSSADIGFAAQWVVSR
jgi:cathepsin L